LESSSCIIAERQLPARYRERFCILLVAISKSDLNQRHYRIVILLIALELQQIIVSTTLPVWKVPADCWPRMIDRALPRGWIKKATCFAKNRIGFSPQNALAIVCGCELPLRRLNVNAEMVHQTPEVALRYLHALID
jgi:hypothetical protein